MKSDGGDASAVDGPGRIGDVGIFDRVARLYDLKPSTRRRKIEPALDLAEREIARVLDVGGGTGQGVRALDVPTGVVVDAAPGMLARARDRGVDGIRGDAARLPVADDAVDAVLILDALHHMARPAAVLEEAARVLRPGGVLVCLEFDPTTVRGRALVAAEHLFGFDSRFFAPGDLAAMVRAAGLSASIPRGGFEYTVAGVA
ncbi:class I SAM-dependent methyltransferase [Halorientalis halophila]|uniref:class I SAM-dependent methyltransferase n=1 Tax=Halorientalis halophila TaxID=3108499 RepID=UPI00300814EB